MRGPAVIVGSYQDDRAELSRDPASNSRWSPHPRTEDQNLRPDFTQPGTGQLAPGSTPDMRKGNRKESSTYESTKGFPMRTTRPRSAVRAMLREFLEKNPVASQVIITRQNGSGHVVAWPWRPVLRTAIRGAITPEVAERSKRYSLDQLGHAVITIRGGYLLIIPMNRELELRVAVSPDYDPRRLKREIAVIARRIDQMNNLI
jgi:hypothetical protein